MNICQFIELHMEQGKAADAIRLLHYNGDLQKFIPELVECIDVGGGEHHGESVFEHLMDSLEYASLSGYHIPLQWAVLLHDIGKPVTKKTIIKSDGTTKTSFIDHEKVGSNLAFSICKRLKMPIETAQYIELMVRNHMFTFGDNPNPRTVRKWLYKVGRNWEDLLKLRMADRKGNRLKRDLPSTTREMAELEELICDIVNSGRLLFKDDLSVSEDFIRRYSNQKFHINQIYKELFKEVGLDEENRNNPVWIKRYLKERNDSIS